MSDQTPAAACDSTWGRGRRLELALMSALALTLFLAFGAGSAVAVGTYGPGTPASFCSGTGVLAGECGELKTLAVDTSNGNVFVADNGNARINQFAPGGTFVRSFGANVVESGAHETGLNAEVCEPIVDVCRKGASTGTGAFGNPIRGIAVDPTTHVVYVASAVSRVAYFNGLTGSFLGQTEGTASTAPSTNVGAPEKFAQLAGLAIDSSTSGGPYLYVAINTGTSPSFKTLIDKFTTSASGLTATSYACQITGTEVATKSSTAAAPTECGGNGSVTHKDGVFEGVLIGGSAGGTAQQGGNLAVDSNGILFIAEAPGTAASIPPGRHVVSVFDKNGNYVKQFLPSGGTPALNPVEPRPEALATLSSGNLLIASGSVTGGLGGTRVQEYNNAAVAFPAAAPITEFGLGTIGNTLGIATKGTDAFVADRPNKKVLKYSTVAVAPSVTSEAATGISKFKATLHGQVTPSFGNVTDCHFEYGTTIAYGSSAPCAPASVGSGNNPVAVGAAISGLSFGTSYHFRLVATNSAGTTNGNDLEFTTALVNNPEAITTPGATLIAQSTAKVAGKVNPNEVAITDCHFNYGTTVAYGLTASCVPANPGGGSSLVDVTASLGGLSSNTTYHFQLDATNGDGNSKGTDQQFKTLPDAPTLSEVVATEVTQVSAKVLAKVNPNSGNVSDCHVDYGPTAAYGSQKPCVPSPGTGAVPVDISVFLTGLNPSTLYHYRVVGTNPGGTTNGADQTFLTLAPNPPGVITDGSSPGLAGTFTLEGRVDPEGLGVSDCHFSYGPTAKYGRTAPCTPSAAGLGTGDAPIAVTVVTEALEPATTYHFRLVATSLRGTSQGKDRIFTTADAPGDSCDNADIRAEQGIEVMQLPNCLALEQVSPPQKHNQPAREASAISPDENRILFKSVATLGDCLNTNPLIGDPFIAERDQGSGWNIECVNSPAANEFGTPISTQSYTPDLTGRFQQINPQLNTSAGARFFDAGLENSLPPITQPLTNLVAQDASPAFNGASEDHSHLYFHPDGGRSGSYVVGDPQPEGLGEDYNLYVSHLDSEGHPVLELLARDHNAKVWGGRCGARLGGMEPTTGINLNLSNGERNQGAISADGSRVYFSTRPDQAGGNCSEANKKRIMLREETPAGPDIKELFASECTRVSPACSATDGDDVYQGASVDQSRVYFTTTRQLADSDLDGTATSCSNATPVSGCDLYLYDANRSPGDRLIDVSAGGSSAATPGIGASVQNSITAISADGSHVYFVARTVLTTDPNPVGAVAQNAANNLYLYTYPQEKLSFVGTLAAGDSGSLFGNGANWQNQAYAVPIGGTGGSDSGGNGHVLLFDSKAQLTAGDTDTARDVYRYDGDGGILERVSTAAPGGSDNGAFEVDTASGPKTGTDYAENGRWASEDGESVAFTTKEPLFPGDTNGVEDSYLWRDGQIYHLPGSSRSSNDARQILPILSHEGSAIVYQSTKRLATSDIDSVEDVYVLRPGGGFRTEPQSVCEGEACQGSPSVPSDDIGVTSGSFSGAGNVKPEITRCPKGKRKVHRKGKIRCVKPAKHKKHAKKQRTGAKHGGQK